jgi:hypothetical protein
MLERAATENDLAEVEEATTPDLATADEWPDEPERDPTDANDPANWPDAGDAANEERDREERERAAAILRAAADRMSGGKSPTPREADWWKEIREEGGIVAEEQRVTAVYENTHGSIVIRQEAWEPGDDDPYVFFPPANVPNLIRKLAEMIGYRVEFVPLGEASAKPRDASSNARGSRGRKSGCDLFAG